MVRDRSEPGEVIVQSIRFSRAFLVFWPGLVLAILTVRIALFNANPSASEYAGWFFLVGAPVATWLMLLGGRPSASVARVLYDAERGD